MGSRLEHISSGAMESDPELAQLRRRWCRAGTTAAPLALADDLNESADRHGRLQGASRAKRRVPMRSRSTSQTLTCRIASAPASGSEGATSGTEGFGRRFIRPDYRLSARPSPDTPGILMPSILARATARRGSPGSNTSRTFCPSRSEGFNPGLRADTAYRLSDGSVSRHRGPASSAVHFRRRSTGAMISTSAKDTC